MLRFAVIFTYISHKNDWPLYKGRVLVAGMYAGLL